jgi:uncharacterized protein YprB with RNaseH-like and TPR domain
MYKDLRSRLSIYEQQARQERTPGDELSRNGSFDEMRSYSACTSVSTKTVPDGEIHTNDDGSYIIVENRYPLSYIYGGDALGRVLDINRRHLPLLTGRTGYIPDISRILFLDTETTGLSSGAGTVAFLIGTGSFENEKFVLRQYFMRDYDEECAVLRAFNELLPGYDILATFNGKAFDWNLLLTRFVFNRMKPALTDPVHLDLLYPSRRIWREKLDSCRLVSLEENILGEHRIDDISGELIPGIYFNYVESGNANEICKVFLHNRLDILSMTVLLVKLCGMLDNPFGETDGNHELLGAGRVFEANGKYDISVECLEKCLQSENNYVKHIASKKLSYMYKKKRDYEKAVRHWAKTLSEGDGCSLFPAIELAKYYEHREKNFEKALSIIRRVISQRAKTGIHNSEVLPELEKRIARLERKLRM